MQQFADFANWPIVGLKHIDSLVNEADTASLADIEGVRISTLSDWLVAQLTFLAAEVAQNKPRVSCLHDAANPADLPRPMGRVLSESPELVGCFLAAADAVQDCIAANEEVNRLNVTIRNAWEV